MTGSASHWRPHVVEVVGRFVDASNATLLAVTDDGATVVYKPRAGQRPLWDFDAATLPDREVLTYRVAHIMGFDVVPETVLADGPYGPGSVQRYVEEDDGFDALALARRGDPALWPLATLDVVINNADRKLGHILSVDSRLVGIDHGLTFHQDDKLRTVLWCFAGEVFPAEMRIAAGRLADALDSGALVSALTEAELEALRRRVALVSDGSHPLPPDDRPPVPWPPY